MSCGESTLLEMKEHARPKKVHNRYKRVGNGNRIGTHKVPIIHPKGTYEI